MPTPATDDFEEDLSGPVPDSPPAPAGSPAAEASLGALSPQLDELVRAIESPAVMGFMRGLFLDILRLLGQVERLRGVVENSGPLVGLPHVFKAVRKSSGYLLTNVETAELRVEGLGDELIETLEAAGFALGHELRRVFEKELVDGGGQSVQQRGLLRACALLENCFQQLTVTLARTFDASLTGGVLFESYRRRREQTLALRGELSALIDDVRRLDEGYSALSSVALLNRVRRFRYEYLHYLMYRDWEDFERFADALELCYESEREMRVLLNKLWCYLEALRSQVQMRAVLADGGNI